MEHGSKWNEPEDAYVDVKDAGWCKGNCKQFRATSNPGNYFVTFKYKIDDDCGTVEYGACSVFARPYIRIG